MVILGAYLFSFRGRVFHGVTLGGVNVSGLKKDELIEIINQKVGKIPHEFTLVSEGRKWTWTWDQLGVEIDPEATADKALMTGRTGLLIERLTQQRLGWEKGISLPVVWTWNNSAVDGLISKLLAELERTAEEPGVTLIGGVANVNPGRDGVILDRQQLKRDLGRQMDDLRYAGLETIPLIPVASQLTLGQQEQVKKQAQSFLGSSVDLTISIDGETRRWNLADRDLVGFLNLRPPGGSVSYEKVSSYTATLAQGIDRPAENAALQFRQTEASGAGRVTVFRPGKEALRLDQPGTIREVTKAVQAIASGAKFQSVTLPIFRTPPEISTSSVNNLGISELIGRGVSYFAGSIPGRIHNITVASSKINGVLVPPGNVFSFNETVGDISAASGYQQAYIIKGGRTVLGDGGGVCQVSTTLFRAVLNAGLPVIERWAHAYRVHYYEENSQMGLDATVFSPSVDFKFQNDTGGYVLIQTSMDEKVKKLTFDLYGTSDGRVVTLGKSRVWDVTPPPPDLYQDDPTLGLGAVKQVDFSAWGAKVSVDWTVIRGEEILQKRTFYSSFRPWQAVFLRGTKI